MDDSHEPRKWAIDVTKLPVEFPTHRMEADFWQSLGRAVATFGYLEVVLGRAIFALAATKPYKESEIEAAYENWLPQLEYALTGQLSGLIDRYGKAVREHPDADDNELDFLLDKLSEASKLRNALCHGYWGSPDSRGAARPFFVDRRLRLLETSFDRENLDQIRQHVVELSCAIQNSVTQIGLQFPGTSGPGKPIK